jgi:Homeodomain
MQCFDTAYKLVAGAVPGNGVLERRQIPSWTLHRRSFRHCPCFETNKSTNKSHTLMLSRSPLPDPPSSLYPLYNNTIPIPTPYQHTVTPRATYSGPSMDPGAADFRAFYPYTPNEVKHRKRTTSTQLKTLESVFRRDTKPNGPLRVELATTLGMTPRGVQVRLL